MKLVMYGGIYDTCIMLILFMKSSFVLDLKWLFQKIFFRNSSREDHTQCENIEMAFISKRMK